MVKAKIDVSALHERLLHHREYSKKLFQSKHPHTVSSLQKYGITPGKIREHAKKLIASGMLASTLVLTTPVITELPKDNMAQLEEIPISEREKEFATELKTHLVTSSLSLNVPQEIMVSKLIHDYWGINATPILEGKRLNHSYAFMGYEQHLRRYPGDSVSQHDEFQKAGIAPAKGAFGYFANSKNEMTEDLIQKEKYYVAVQTLYLRDWNTNWVKLKDWYKHRKVVVVNPENGKTVVAAIADAGPAKWTGKQFGGSPEVMEHLGLITGKKKGKVILFFANDPEDQIALGPVGYNRTEDLAKK